MTLGVLAMYLVAHSKQDAGTSVLHVDRHGLGHAVLARRQPVVVDLEESISDVEVLREALTHRWVGDAGIEVPSKIRYIPCSIIWVSQVYS
jgi:hypothetical protein